MNVKFFVLGFPKSGTSTLEEAFERAGLRAAHWLVPEGYCGKLIYEDFTSERNPLTSLRRYDIVAQADVCRLAAPNRPAMNYWPQLDFDVIRSIQTFNRNMKFILNRRDISDLIDSINRWANVRWRITIAEIPGLPAGAGATNDELHEWIEGHYRACAEHFAGNPNYFEYEITDPQAHARLERFSNVKLPWWGIANPNERASPDPRV